ncbi:hypothetical protein RCO48_36140 [Peribacillus frigoritolerans]|nr:hypothetical protein [Peribacillus frigoritolerans]
MQELKGVAAMKIMERMAAIIAGSMLVGVGINFFSDTLSFIGWRHDRDWADFSLLYRTSDRTGCDFEQHSIIYICLVL